MNVYIRGREWGGEHDLLRLENLSICLFYDSNFIFRILGLVYTVKSITLNLNHEMDSLYFISIEKDPYP